MIPSIERLRELFDYDPLTGVLVRKSRPREDFSSNRAWRIWQAKHAGKPTGCPHKGYIQITITIDGVRRLVPAHRLVWALTYGRWPTAGVDHRDGDGTNNKLSNLREATHKENAQNFPPSATRGTRLVDGKWGAAIRVNKNVHWLGRFSTREEAHAAYLAAKARLHTFQPVPRE